MKPDMAHQADSRMWMSNSKTTVRRLCRFGCGLMLVVGGMAPGVLAAQPDSKPAATNNSPPSHRSITIYSYMSFSYVSIMFIICGWSISFINLISI